MTSLSPILTALTIAAGLSLGVERTLELLKNIMDQSKGVVDLRDLISRARAAVAEVQQSLRSPPPASSASAAERFWRLMALAIKGFNIGPPQ